MTLKCSHLKPQTLAWLKRNEQAVALAAWRAAKRLSPQNQPVAYASIRELALLMDTSDSLEIIENYLWAESPQIYPDCMQKLLEKEQEDREEEEALRLAQLQQAERETLKQSGKPTMVLDAAGKAHYAGMTPGQYSHYIDGRIMEVLERYPYIRLADPVIVNVEGLSKNTFCAKIKHLIFKGVVEGAMTRTRNIGAYVWLKKRNLVFEEIPEVRACIEDVANMVAEFHAGAKIEAVADKYKIGHKQARNFIRNGPQLVITKIKGEANRQY